MLESVKDVKGIEAAFLTASTPSAVLDPVANDALAPAMNFGDVVLVALLGLHAFYGMGHQSMIFVVAVKVSVRVDADGGLSMVGRYCRAYFSRTDFRVWAGSPSGCTVE